MQLSPLSDLFFPSAPQAGGAAGLEPGVTPFGHWLSAQSKQLAPLAAGNAPAPLSQYPLNWGFPGAVPVPLELPAVAPEGEAVLSVAGSVDAASQPALAAAEPVATVAALPRPATAPMPALDSGPPDPADAKWAWEPAKGQGLQLKPSQLPAVEGEPPAMSHAVSPSLDQQRPLPPAAAVLADKPVAATENPNRVSLPDQSALQDQPALEDQPSLPDSATSVLSGTGIVNHSVVQAGSQVDPPQDSASPVTPMVVDGGAAVPLQAGPLGLAAELERQPVVTSPGSSPPPVIQVSGASQPTATVAPVLHQPLAASAFEPPTEVATPPQPRAVAGQARGDVPASDGMDMADPQRPVVAPAALSEVAAAPVPGPLRPLPSQETANPEGRGENRAATGSEASALAGLQPQGRLRPELQPQRPVAEATPAAEPQPPELTPARPSQPDSALPAPDKVRAVAVPPPVSPSHSAMATPLPAAATPVLTAAATIMAGLVPPPVTGNPAPGSRAGPAPLQTPLWTGGAALKPGVGPAAAEVVLAPAPVPPPADETAPPGRTCRDGSLSDQRFADLFAASPPPQAPRPNGSPPLPLATNPGGFESHLGSTVDLTAAPSPVDTGSATVITPFGQPAAPQAPAPATNPAPLLTLPSGLQVPEQEVLQQVFGQFHPRNLGGSQRLSLKLNPEELGEVRLELSVDKDMVRAHLHAQSQQVQEVLEKHLPRLREAFEQQGLKFQELQVSVDAGRDGGRGFFGQSQQHPPFMSRPPRWQSSPGPEVDALPAPPVTKSRSHGGLSLRI